MRIVILLALALLLAPLTGCPEPIGDDDDATGDDDDATGDDDDATGDDDDATGDDDDATGDDDDATGDDDDATGDDDDATGDDDDATGDDDDATGDDDDATGDDDDATGDDDDSTVTNIAPTFAFVAPAGGETSDLSFTISWTDSDPDDDASITIGVDTDASGFDGTVLAAGLSEDDTADSLAWDTSGLAEGDYWVYATIDDGTNAPVQLYAAGPVTVDHPDPPTFTFVEPDGVNDTADASFLVSWIDDDPDSNAVFNLYVDDDAVGANGTLIVGGLLEDDPADQYLVDTSVLANGDWWFYVVITDGTTTSTVYSSGAVTVSHPTVCLTPSGAGLVTVDVPSVDVLIDVTLNGQPISSANTGDADEGSLRIVDTATGEIVADLPGVWNDGPDQPLTPYELQLVAGVYDIYYEVVDDGPNWPSNQNHLLVDALVIDTSTTYTVDVPVAMVDLDVTIDGAALSTANTSGSDEGAIQLREVGGSSIAYDSPGVWDDGTNTALTPFTFQVVAGDYDVWYQVVDDGPNWPENSDALLQSAMTFSSGSMTVNVPVSDVTLDVTLNGAPVSAANAGDLDEGSVEIRDPDTGAVVVDLPGVWDDGPDQPLTPYTFQVVSGDYALWYDIVDDGPNWPDNETAVLDPAFDLSTDGTFTIDVPSVDVQLDVTLNGAPISSANSGDLDEGSLVLQDPDTGGVVADLAGVWDDGPDTPLTPYSLQLVGGDYDIYYEVVDDGPNWPSNQNALLEPGYDLSTSGTYVIDVPVADVSLDVTLNGAAISALNTGDLDEGSLTLREVGRSDIAYDSAGVWNDGPDQPLTPFTFQVVAGAYDVWYQVVDDGPNWPDNTNSLLTAAQTFATGTTIVNVGSFDLTIDVTLNGAAVSSANSGDNDEGALQLRDPDSGAVVVDFPGVWDDGPDQPLTPYTAQLLVGEYDIFYDVVDDGPNWPDNQNALLQCLDVQ